MKHTTRMAACLVALLAFVFIAGLAAADTRTETIGPGSSEPVSLGSMSEDDLLTISWSSTSSVSAVLTGPSGYSESYSSSTIGYDLVNVPYDGTYTITFTNPSSTNTAVVTLTYDVVPFNPIETAHDIMWWIMIVAVIIVVAVVAIIVLVIVLGTRKKKAAPAQPGIVTPMTAGMCPVCGAQTDTNAPFCAKCGAKFR